MLIFSSFVIWLWKESDKNVTFMPVTLVISLEGKIKSISKFYIAL